MKLYQVYSVDQTGAISGNRTIEAQSDREAILAVRSIRRSLDTQIWHRDCRVAIVPGRPAIADE